MLINIVAALLFLMMVYFDVKSKKVPSILGTGIIFVLAIVNVANIEYGIIMFIFAWLLYEASFFGGIADVKMITAIGLLVSSPLGIISIVIILTVYTAIYNALIRMVLKAEGDYAGTVPIFLSFLAAWATGGLSL